MHLQKPDSFDDLISALLEKPWHIEAERLGGLEIDYQFEFGGTFNRQISGLRTPEYAINVCSGSAKRIGPINSVRYQPAFGNKEAEVIDRG
jgi:hypothetical protein